MNRSAAERLWPGEAALGKRFRFPGDTARPWFTVVGVVGNVRALAATAEPQWEYYLPHAQLPGVLNVSSFHRRLSIVVRPSVDPATLTQPIRRVLSGLDARARVRGIVGGLATYDRLKTVFGPGAFQESILNTLGYRFLSLNRLADAIASFERNAREYPYSSDVHDSLGEGLLALGKTQAVMVAYRRSYDLDPRNERALHEAERLRRLLAGTEP